jgi:chaperonin GroES
MIGSSLSAWKKSARQGNGKILESGEVRALDVKVGDQVLFGKYAGTEVKVEGEELLVMKEDDIMAVIEA